KTLIYDISNLKNVGQFASDLWKVNAALAQDLQDLNSIKSNLALTPLKAAEQAGEAITDAYGESQMTSGEVYQLLKQLDSNGGGLTTPVAPSTVPKTVAPELVLAPEVKLDDILFLNETTNAFVNGNLVSSSPVFISNGGGSFSGGVSSEISLAASNNNEDNSNVENNENNSSNASSTPEVDPDSSITTSSTLENTEDGDSNTSSTVTSTIEIIPDVTTSSTSSTIDWVDPDLNTTSTTSTTEGETEIVTSTPENEPAPLATNGLVVINEIAWGGTQAATNDEWLELYNAADFDIDLSSWTLTDGNDLEVVFATSTVIARGQYFLLERTSDNTISTKTADLVYVGSLRDGGEKLILKNGAGQVVDEVNCLAKWLAGRNIYDKETMERKSASLSGSDPLNWQNTPMAVWQGKDANNLPVAGTPGSANSPVIYLTGELSADRVLSSGRYILGNLIIPVGKKLEISEGVTIIGGLASNLKVFGQLITNGSTENPVIFTAYKDSSVSGSFYKQDANWGYIQILSGGQGEFKNTQFNYGNSKWDSSRPKGLLYAENSNLILGAVVFDKNLNEKPRGDWPLVNSVNAVLEIKYSQFLDSPKGLVIKNGSLNLLGNTFDGLGLSALEAEDGGDFIIENNTFKNLGWEYLNREYWEMPQPLISPVYFKNFLPKEIKTNVYENNILNSWEIFGRLGTSGQIDTLGEAPAIMGTLEIPAGINLEVKAGSIIKMVFGSSLRVYGSLISRGTPDGNQVIFTSIHDDEYGEDLDLGQPLEIQTEGNEWSQILIQSGEASVLDDTWVRYANGVTAAETAGSVFVGGLAGNNEGSAAPFAAHNLTIEYSRVPSVALHLKDAYGVIIDGCLLKNYSKRVFDLNGYTDGTGIWVNGGNPKISNCVIDTFNFGVRLKPESTPELSNIEYFNVDFPLGP
ncbi:MAG TPA: lamin tail domain-containing protein, partial [Candidatus Magasanikbacteria bacterium]|nr:lamin tail domain-containing protein [Candidatus Magasanikbacteria bacterium]